MGYECRKLLLKKKNAASTAEVQQVYICKLGLTGFLDIQLHWSIICHTCPGHISISPSAIEGTKLPNKSLLLHATYVHTRGSRCLSCGLARVRECDLRLCRLQLAQCCLLLHTEALGQTPSALINVAINQASADICVISPQCSSPGGAGGTLC